MHGLMREGRREPVLYSTLCLVDLFASSLTPLPRHTLDKAEQRVGNRPGRIEPRAVKRRPKSYPMLTKSRGLAREYSSGLSALKLAHPHGSA